MLCQIWNLTSPELECVFDEIFLLSWVVLIIFWVSFSFKRYNPASWFQFNSTLPAVLFFFSLPLTCSMFFHAIPLPRLFVNKLTHYNLASFTNLTTKTSPSMNLWHLTAFFLEVSTVVVLVFALKAPVWFTLKGSVPIYGDIKVTANLWEQCYSLVATDTQPTPHFKPPLKQFSREGATSNQGRGDSAESADENEDEPRKSCAEFRILNIPGYFISFFNFYSSTRWKE